MIPKGVLSSAETISVTRTKPHSNTPDTENATKNLNKNSECKSNQIKSECLGMTHQQCRKLY